MSRGQCLTPRGRTNLQKSDIIIGGLFNLVVRGRVILDDPSASSSSFRRLIMNGSQAFHCDLAAQNIIGHDSVLCAHVPANDLGSTSPFRMRLSQNAVCMLQ